MPVLRHTPFVVVVAQVCHRTLGKTPSGLAVSLARTQQAWKNTPHVTPTEDSLLDVGPSSSSNNHGRYLKLILLQAPSLPFYQVSHFLPGFKRHLPKSLVRQFVQSTRPEAIENLASTSSLTLQELFVTRQEAPPRIQFPNLREWEAGLRNLPNAAKIHSVKQKHIWLHGKTWRTTPHSVGKVCHKCNI